jgi:hypothetical protein
MPAPSAAAPRRADRRASTPAAAERHRDISGTNRGRRSG